MNLLVKMFPNELTKRILFLFMGVFFFSGAAHSNEIPSFILNSIEKNPEVLALKESINSQNEALKQIYAENYPNLTANVDGKWQRKANITTSGAPTSFDVTNPTTYSLTLTQDIWQGGKSLHEIKSQKLSISSSHLNYYQTLQNKIIEAVKLHGELIKNK